MYSSHREPVKKTYGGCQYSVWGARGSNCILEHNQFSKTSLICHLDIKYKNDRENRTGVDIFSQCDFREGGGR